jgi:nitrate/TMAO reductase-like tetraheme cytochrome c subunit
MFAVSMFTRRKITIVIGLLALLLVGGVVAFEPVTRNVVANNDLCLFCHVAQEYQADSHLAYSKYHPPRAEDGSLPDAKQARCVDCHLPSGAFNSAYAYTHFVSFTDLFGHFRYRNAERSGAWIPPRQAAAYRVRDRLLEYDSPTCRTCHVMEEIKPKRERGVNAHNKAVEEQKTCIECHYNEKHRSVDLRDDEFERSSTQEKVASKQ